MTPPCPLRRFSRSLPDKTALVFGVSRWSYRELDAAVETCCAALEQLGVGSGDRIAFFSPNRPELVFLLFAACRLGVAVAPVNAKLAQAEVLDCLARLKPRLVFAELKGLKPKTTYHFRLGAVNASGTSYGADTVFQTLPER